MTTPSLHSVMERIESAPTPYSPALAKELARAVAPLDFYDALFCMACGRIGDYILPYINTADHQAIKGILNRTTGMRISAHGWIALFSRLEALGLTRQDINAPLDVTGALERDDSPELFSLNSRWSFLTINTNPNMNHSPRMVIWHCGPNLASPLADWLMRTAEQMGPAFYTGLETSYQDKRLSLHINLIVERIAADLNVPYTAPMGDMSAHDRMALRAPYRTNSLAHILQTKPMTALMPGPVR